MILEHDRAAVLDVLRIRFQQIQPALLARLEAIDQTLLLQELLRQAVTIPSLAEFEALLREAVAVKNSLIARISD